MGWPHLPALHSMDCSPFSLKEGRDGMATHLFRLPLDLMDRLTTLFEEVKGWGGQPCILSKRGGGGDFFFEISLDLMDSSPLSLEGGGGMG